MPAKCNSLSNQGNRRMTLAMLGEMERADDFEGLPQGTAEPFVLLSVFQKALPYLGLSPHTAAWMTYLVTCTQSQDWEVGSRPIAWPSAKRQCEQLGLEPSAAKSLNRSLAEAGVIVMRDGPTGKRFGRREQGRIVEAYGFDLSPLAYRHDEFKAIAAEAQAKRELMKRLQTRAKSARQTIAQIGDVLRRQGEMPTEWTGLRAETDDLVKGLRKRKSQRA